MTGFEPGLLDKLFDDDWRGAASPVLRHLSLEEVKSMVARDLEALLNTRMAFDDAKLEAFPECRRSIITYGLGDFAGLSLASHYDRTFICRSLEQAILRHESRLRNVKVKLEVDGQSSTNMLNFVITALLVLPELTEPVNFDAMLQPTTLQYSITRGSSGKVRAA